jgi:hypothetical protein
MTTRIPENFPAWFVGCNLITATGDTMPPRDPKPNDDDDDEEDDEEERKDDHEPAVIREPDEDE